MRFQINQKSSLAHVPSGFSRRKNFLPERAQNPHFEQSDFADFGSENQQG